MKNICLIGNYFVGGKAFDGQHLKVRLYYDILCKEGFNVQLIDLNGFLRRPFSTINKIKKGIETCDVVVLMSASKGAEILIPLINKFNKKKKKRFIFSLIGTSVLHKSLDKLDAESQIDFLVNKNYSLCKKRRRMSLELKKIDCILPETDLLTSAYKSFFNLNNVITMTNFRDDCVNKYSKTVKTKDIVFVSRVASIKGIFDLLDALEICKSKVSLDIYGPLQLNKKELNDFNNRLRTSKDVFYKGCIDQNSIIETISKYKIFVFPTKYLNEGAPGVLAESLIAGTPIISSRFPQSSDLLLEGYDSLIYEFGSVASLSDTIDYIFKDNNKLIDITKNAKKSGTKFLYSWNRDNFLEIISGCKDDK